MKWFKMDTNNVLFGGFENWQLAALLKYKALCAQLESEPSDNQLNRILTKKECNFVKSLVEVQQNSIESSIKSLKKRRESDLKRKRKNKELNKNSAAESANFPYKEEIREDKKKINKKSFLAEFETWWTEYPNKKSKQAAQRIFEKLLVTQTVSFDELLAGAKAYAEHCRREKTDPHYIKHPSTWLNQGCWSDVYESGDEESLFKVQWAGGSWDGK